MKQFKYYIIVACLAFFTLDSTAQDTGIISMNQVRYDSLSGDSILYGLCDEGMLRSHSCFNEYFEYHFSDYNPVLDSLVMFTEQFFPMHLTVVLGTWCSDSQMQVPRMMKLLETIGYPPHQIQYVCVDRTKTAEGIDLSNLDIAFVPTFIFSIEGKEMMRIVESPETTLEGDILRFLIDQE